MTVIIECISWLIKVTNNNDARWKPEINLTPLNLTVMLLVSMAVKHNNVY